MKKVYEVHQQINVNGEGFHNTALLGNYYYMDEAEVANNENPLTTTDFAEAVKILAEGEVWRSSPWKFFKWEGLQFSMGFDSFSVPHRKFKSLAIRYHCTEVHPSIKELSAWLTADQFCEYLRDNGWEGWQK